MMVSAADSVLLLIMGISAGVNVTDNNCECNWLILIDDNQCKGEGTFIDSRDQCSEVFLNLYIYWFYNRSKSTPTSALTTEVGVLLLIMEIIVGDNAEWESVQRWVYFY